MAFLFTALVAGLATASPVSDLITKQALSAVPHGWELKSAAKDDHKIDLFIRLKEENQDKLEKRVIEISNPDHRDYGKHLSKEEVDTLVAPTKANVDAVSKWLSSHGLDAGKVDGGYLTVTVTAAKAKELLNADYGVYAHPKTGRQTVRATSYSVPKNLDDAIQMIQPTTMFSDLGVGSNRMIDIVPASEIDTRGDDVCATERTSARCLRQNYNIHGYTPRAGKSTLGIAGFLDEVPSYNDLSLYLTKYTPEIPANTTTPITSINGGLSDPKGSGEGEANLDTQITVPLTYPINNIYWSTGGMPPFQPAGSSVNNTNEPYFEWLQYVSGQHKLPTTISISYGDDERTVPVDYARAVCFQFLKLGARGVSVFVSAGDAGPGGSDSCTVDANGKKTVKEYLPDFPASCPWVTTVGGTTHYGDDEQSEPDGGSGFSNIFTRPWYQWSDVEDYLDGLPEQFEKIKFNRRGRAYPDVSALYRGYPIYFQGKLGYSGGTSASCPTTASIFALLSDYLLSQGRPPMGFVNPWLYRRGTDGLRDLKKGHNNVCKTEPAFPSVEGWDATTGLGVPDFGKLLDLIRD